MPIKESDRYKTAFNTKYGHFEWNSLCFGLCNAPATFVQGLNEIFSGNAYRIAEKNGHELIKDISETDLQKRKINLLDKYLTIYIDDIIIWSKTPEEHADHLAEVFRRLTDFDLLIQSPKSFFAMEKVEYLGHEVSRHGIRAMEDKA